MKKYKLFFVIVIDADHEDDAIDCALENGIRSDNLYSINEVDTPQLKELEK